MVPPTEDLKPAFRAIPTGTQLESLGSNGEPAATGASALPPLLQRTTGGGGRRWRVERGDGGYGQDVVRLEVSPELRFLLPDDQLADVLDRFRLPLAPYSRCTACGGDLRPVPKAEVVDLLEPGTRRTQRDFVRCRSCGRVYWHGAHAARLDQLVRQHLPGPPDRGPASGARSARREAERIDRLAEAITLRI